MTDHAKDPRYFVLRQEDNETWKLITQLMEPVEAASREEAIVKATEGQDAKEQTARSWFSPRTSTRRSTAPCSRRRSTSSSDAPVVLA